MYSKEDQQKLAELIEAGITTGIGETDLWMSHDETRFCLDGAAVIGKVGKEKAIEFLNGLSSNGNPFSKVAELLKVDEQLIIAVSDDYIVYGGRERILEQLKKGEFESQDFNSNVEYFDWDEFNAREEGED